MCTNTNIRAKTSRCTLDFADGEADDQTYKFGNLFGNLEGDPPGGGHSPTKKPKYDRRTGFGVGEAFRCWPVATVRAKDIQQLRTRPFDV